MFDVSKILIEFFFFIKANCYYFCVVKFIIVCIDVTVVIYLFNYQICLGFFPHIFRATITLQSGCKFYAIYAFHPIN